jgi:hypothetical protein
VIRTKRSRMKTKTKKDFDAVKFAREQKDRLSAKFANMTKEEILEYLRRKSVERGRMKSDD